MLAAGLLHLQRRNGRGARNKLSEGIAKLRKYEPTHRGIVLTELVAVPSDPGRPERGSPAIPDPAGHPLRRHFDRAQTSSR